MCCLVIVSLVTQRTCAAAVTQAPRWVGVRVYSEEICTEGGGGDASVAEGSTRF